jgi:hypothetical protein
VRACARAGASLEACLLLTARAEIVPVPAVKNHFPGGAGIIVSAPPAIRINRLDAARGGPLRAAWIPWGVFFWDVTVLGPDPLTDVMINLFCLRNAALLLAVYLVVVLVYLSDELGLVRFRSKRLEAWFSRVSLLLFVVGSPVFIVAAMVFTFMWGFGA